MFLPGDDRCELRAYDRILLVSREDTREELSDQTKTQSFGVVPDEIRLLLIRS